MKNKKLLITLLFTLSFFALALGFVACEPSENSSSGGAQEILSTPTNVQLITDKKADDSTSWNLTWDKVENARSYDVYVNGKCVQSSKTQFNLDDFVNSGRTYTFEVVATANNRGYEASTAAVLEEEVKEASKGLKYTRLSDGTYEVTAKDVANRYITGNLFLPDTYRGIEITSIGERSFYRLDYESIGGGGLMAGKGNFITTAVRLPKFLTNIGEHAFGACRNMTSLELPDGVKTIGRSAFGGCNKLQKVNIPDGITVIENSTFSACEVLTPIILPEGITSIGSSAFSDCAALTSINLPKGITSIAQHSFSGCAALTSIKIPEGVTSIGMGAFSNCEKLAQINVPESVTYVAANAFKGSLWLKNQPDGLVYINDICYVCKGEIETVTAEMFKPNTSMISSYAFGESVSGQENETLKKVELPYGITRIEDNVFESCSALEEVVIPNTVTDIGNYVFEGCTNLRSVNLPDSVVNIGDSAFAGCASLKNVVLPQNLQTISQGLFSSAKSLENVVIPNSVKEIGISAFGYCTSLKNITIPEGVEVIGSSAFYGCSQLESVIIPNSVKEMGVSVFRLCTALKSVTLSNNVSVIGEYFLSECENLESIIITGKIKQIGSNAFMACRNLKEIYYVGTEEGWGEIEFGNRASNPTNYGGTVYYYSETQPEEEGNYWHYDVDGITPVIWTKGN